MEAFREWQKKTYEKDAPYIVVLAKKRAKDGSDISDQISTASTAYSNVYTNQIRTTGEDFEDAEADENVVCVFD